jgi:FkbM family methyltransferase
MTVFDVGAHAGYYTLAMAAKVGRNGRVFAFEPSAENVAHLRRHLDINSISNVTVIEAAVCDRAGAARFHSVGYVGQLSSNGYAVATVRLDDYPVPDFIKMDIEGAEGSAMRGARRTLSRQPVLFIALHGEPGRSECLQLLKEFGYTIEYVAPNEIRATTGC